MALAPPNRTPASSIQSNGSVDTLVGSSAGSPDSETRYLESVSEVPVSFEMDRKSTSTSLMWHCGLLWTITSWSSGKGDFVTELRDHTGEVIGSRTVPAKGHEMVNIGRDTGPIKRASWLSKNKLFARSYASFKNQDKSYKWYCINEQGKVSIVLRDTSTNAWIAKYRSCCRTGSGKVVSVHLMLNPQFRSDWDIAVLSLMVTEQLSGGATPMALSYEDIENASGKWAGMYYGVP